MITTSIRAPCPFCNTPLSGKVDTIKNKYKLDNGDPDYREITKCPKCGRNIFTLQGGMRVDHMYIPPASP